MLALTLALACSPRVELDAAGRAMLDPLRERALRPAELVSRLALAQDATVADVGAGPGFLMPFLAAAVPRGRVIATDLNRDYLAVLRGRARAAGLGNIETRAVTAEDPGLGVASVDAVILCQVDHYLRDRVAYFRALAAALRPNGRLVLLNYHRYRAADREAAQAAGYRPLDGWRPSAAFFVDIFVRGGRT